MNDLARRLEDAVETIGRVNSWLVFALVLLMAGNVLLRYGFQTGSVWAQELEWHLLVPIALVGMAYALRRDGHLRVDVLYARFPARVRAAIDAASSLALLGCCVAIVLLSLRYVDQSWSIGEGSSDPGGLPWRFVPKALIPFGFALLAVQAAAEVLRAGVVLVGGRHAAR